MIKNFFKSIVKILIILLTAIIVGFGLLVLVMMLPVDRMEQNVASSIEIFVNEDVYPQVVSGYNTMKLDNETEAIMLLGAINDNHEMNVFEKAMAVPHKTMEHNHSLCYTLKEHLWDLLPYDGEGDYDRYWHGYLVWLKPLLLFFDYADFRVINMIIQLSLDMFLVYSLVKKKRDYLVLPFFLYLVVQNPVATAISMQFSSMYYITVLSSLFILYQSDWISEKYTRFTSVFCLIGCFTVFFDFLTYPLVSCIIPLSLWIVLKNQNEKFLSNLLTMIRGGISWGIGYFGLWFSKWLLASAILNKNVLREAIGQASLHTGDADIFGEILSPIDVLFKNIHVYVKWPYLLCLVSIIVYYMIKIYRNAKYDYQISEQKESNQKWVCLRSSTNLILLVLALIPCIWLMALSSHSAWCYWYTCRNLSASAFAIACIFIPKTPKIECQINSEG